MPLVLAGGIKYVPHPKHDEKEEGGAGRAAGHAHRHVLASGVLLTAGTLHSTSTVLTAAKKAE